MPCEGIMAEGKWIFYLRVVDLAENGKAYAPAKFCEFYFGTDK